MILFGNFFNVEKKRYCIEVRKYFTVKKDGRTFNIEDLIENYVYKARDGHTLVKFDNEQQAEFYIKRFIHALYDGVLKCYYKDGHDGVFNEEYGYFHYLYRIVREDKLEGVV